MPKSIRDDEQDVHDAFTRALTLAKVDEPQPFATFERALWTAMLELGRALVVLFLARRAGRLRPVAYEHERVAYVLDLDKPYPPVLDEHGDLGVLRALSIEPHHRRRGHGAALAAFVLRLAQEHGLGSVYAVAASPWFLEEVGFQHIERVLLPRAALRLTSIANVLPAAYIFEITPSVAGRRTPRRMVARTLSELFAQPDRAPLNTTGPRARRKRQQETENERDDAPTTRQPANELLHELQQLEAAVILCGAGLRPLGWNERNVESDGGPRTYTAFSAPIGGRACQIPARTVSFLRQIMNGSEP